MGYYGATNADDVPEGFFNLKVVLCWNSTCVLTPIQSYNTYSTFCLSHYIETKPPSLIAVFCFLFDKQRPKFQ